MTDIVVYGTGGMGRETADLIQALSDDGADWQLVGFIDDDPECIGEAIHELPVLGGRHWLESRTIAVAVAIGNPHARRRVFESIQDIDGCYLPILCHPAAAVGPRVEMGMGSIIGANAVITTDISVGISTIINIGATISHDDQLGDYVTLAPGVHLAGGVLAGRGADIGIGASVLPGRTIGQWSIAGAGAVVVHDVLPGTTVIGSPARAISRRAIPRSCTA